MSENTSHVNYIYPTSRLSIAEDNAAVLAMMRRLMTLTERRTTLFQQAGIASLSFEDFEAQSPTKSEPWKEGKWIMLALGAVVGVILPTVFPSLLLIPAVVLSGLAGLAVGSIMSEPDNHRMDRAITRYEQYLHQVEYDGFARLRSQGNTQEHEASPIRSNHADRYLASREEAGQIAVAAART